MKHTGFTPGPWRLDERDGGGYRVTASEEHVTFLDSTRYVDRRPDEEAEANARLIADAPRLAERAEKLEKGLADLVEAHESGSFGVDGACGWFNARALLAEKP